MVCGLKLAENNLLSNLGTAIRARVLYLRAKVSHDRLRYWNMPFKRLSNLVYRGEERMEQEELTSVSRALCDHSKQRRYTQKQFDILNGFELAETRCLNCHKILVLNIGKIDASKTFRAE